MGYRIKTVSEITGIPKNTLVAWERRYGILDPERLPNGYRQYTDADIATLQQLKSAMADGLKISEAVDVVLEQRKQKTKSGGVSRDVPAATQQEAFEPVIVELVGALEDFDRPRAETVVARLLGTTDEQIIDLVYFPLLRRIGDKWERGEVTVAQEHFASAFIRDQLIAMLLRVGCGPDEGTHVACVTFPGEQHELAVLGLAVRLALSGCRVTYLGADLPVGELCRFAQDHEPAWLCVSVIRETPAEEITTYAKALRSGVEGSRIAIGGAALAQVDLPEVDGVTFLEDWHDLSI
jgi:DNA-binding transcriptional MerR regulator